MRLLERATNKSFAFLSPLFSLHQPGIFLVWTMSCRLTILALRASPTRCPKSSGFSAPRITKEMRRLLSQRKLQAFSLFMLLAL